MKTQPDLAPPRQEAETLETWVSRLPLLFASSTAITADVSAAVKAGLVRRVGPTIYTTDRTTPLDELVPRNAIAVASLRFPGAVLSHRSALELRPVDGHLFLTGSYEKTDPLPGVTLRLVRGPGALPGDTPLLGLYQASLPRALLENLKRTRRAAGISRVVTREALEERLERELAQRGEAGLNRLRDDARSLAPLLGAEDAFTQLDGLIGALLSTRDASGLLSDVARARAAGEPYDALRIDRFELLARELRERWTDTSRATRTLLREERQHLAFIDAYFSNYIEGTKFDVAEAQGIVFDNVVPALRPADAHDVKGTFEVLVDESEMRVSATAFERFEDFENLLARRHRRILGGRPEKHPGEYKQIANRAGDTLFVAPELVRGTLARGFELLRTLEVPFQRAAFVMFLVAEVHPFEDGNGRLARAMMNAELHAGGEVHVVIVTAYRTDYLDVLRRLSRQDDPHDYVRMLDRAQEFTSRLPLDDLGELIAVLERCNAFDDSGTRVMRMPPPLEEG